LEALEILGRPSRIELACDDPDELDVGSLGGVANY
jgi:hypothetical protein